MLDEHQHCMPLAASSAGRQLYRWSHQWTSSCRTLRACLLPAMPEQASIQKFFVTKAPTKRPATEDGAADPVKKASVEGHAALAPHLQSSAQRLTLDCFSAAEELS